AHFRRQFAGGGDHGRRHALTPAIDPAPELDALRDVLRNLFLEQASRRGAPTRHVVARVGAQPRRPGAGHQQSLIDVGVEAVNQLAAVFRRARPDHHAPAVLAFHPLHLKASPRQFADAITPFAQRD
ncbi:hypothetical protein RZS08_33840, partial [Arthrospira platensis SPKY1]|nr:hypothetical protein [Arthrospira platensis SPKY1]